MIATKKSRLKSTWFYIVQNAGYVKRLLTEYLLINYFCSANSQTEMDEWVNSIANSVLANPLHKLIAARALMSKSAQKAREKEREKERLSLQQNKINNTTAKEGQAGGQKRASTGTELVDFNQLHEMATMCATCYKTSTEIKAAYLLCYTSFHAKLINKKAPPQTHVACWLEFMFPLDCNKLCDFINVLDFVRYGIHATVLSDTKNGAEKVSVKSFYIIHPQSKTQTIVICSNMWGAMSSSMKEKLQGDDAVDDGMLHSYSGGSKYSSKVNGFAY